ncbi:hypothetical protein ABI_09110 [Asticcacaulis biprosthecium C19]|uniref:DUF2490 domain-containing protein n=1 Tax=Asticcacaulis biprosthecium C19 TaxID=715226 RepID=F4QGE6_9CAUL|nr:DUF2490 domain-containing protein [Asticcacaulis biprosthecium]EGF92474.1 hypothetical protein ABI_09110 [Asticcacaulis biprosthecium C19]
MFIVIKPRAFILLAVLAPCPAYAADGDFQAWTSSTVSFATSDRVTLAVEGQARWTDDASRLGQALVRPSVSLKLGKTTSAAIGYAYVFTNPVGPAESREHRLWQQLSYELGSTDGGLKVTARSRLEQRHFEGFGQTGWRLRQQVRATKPLDNKISVVAWSEVFVSVNETAWGQRKGLDRWRNAVGVNIPIKDNMTFEPVYIHQWVNRRDTDRMDHVISLALNAKF